jgi:hypothetical protein
MSEKDESLVIDGVGMAEAMISYPGHAEDPDYGMWSFERASSDVSGFSGLATPIHKSEGLTLDECQAQFVSQRNTAPHAVWLYRNVTALGLRTGQCIYYLVAASRLQQGVWRGFFAHASKTTNLAHFASINVKEVRASLGNANRDIACNGDTSKVCTFWSEFDLDDSSELGCFPNSQGTNIVSPTELLLALRRSGIQYPPPSPPPPLPPEPPPSPSPPPDEFVCSVNSLPDARFVKDHGNVAPAPPPGVGNQNSWIPTSRSSSSVPCWRWDENLLWPPRQAHGDVFEAQYQCAGQKSLAIQWTTSFRQSRVDERLLRSNNGDTCKSANDGVCDDGGNGDVSRRTTPITLVGGGVKVKDMGTESCKPIGIANNVQRSVQEYTVMRIEPQFDFDRLPAIGDRIFILPDASSFGYQTVSGNSCFDGDPAPSGYRGEEKRNWNAGKVSPIGPLEVTYVHNEQCDGDDCLCTPEGSDSDVCHGHNSYTRKDTSEVSDFGGFPRKTSYFKARNIYDKHCRSVTVTKRGDGLCDPMSAASTPSRVPCVGANAISWPGDGNNSILHKQYCAENGTHANEDWSCVENEYQNDNVEHNNPNKNVNSAFGNYDCGMRERVLVFGPTGNYCPYGQE